MSEQNQQSVAFDRAADYYDETRGFPRGEERHIAQLIVRAGQLTAHSRVLEVGIGTGRIALPLAPHVQSVTGIDLSRPMLDRLRAKRTTEPIHVVEGDATRLPFPAHHFDAVIGVHVFHLIAGWEAALREVARVLRPDGLLLSGYNDHEANPADPYRWLWEVWEKEVGQERLPNVGISRDQYSTFAEDAGFRSVGDKSVHVFSSTHTLREFLDRLERRVWSSLWRVPDEVYPRALDAIHRAVEERGADLPASYEAQGNFTVRAYRPPTS